MSRRLQQLRLLAFSPADDATGGKGNPGLLHFRVIQQPVARHRDIVQFPKEVLKQFQACKKFRSAMFMAMEGAKELAGIAQAFGPNPQLMSLLRFQSAQIMSSLSNVMAQVLKDFTAERLDRLRPQRNDFATIVDYPATCFNPGRCLQRETTIANRTDRGDRAAIGARTCGQKATAEGRKVRAQCIRGRLKSVMQQNVKVARGVQLAGEPFEFTVDPPAFIPIEHFAENSDRGSQTPYADAKLVKRLWLTCPPQKPGV